MNKRLKVILIILGSFIGIILLDTIQAKIFQNSPFIKIRENFSSDSTYFIDKGLLVDHYHCSNKEEKTLFKKEKYSCPLEEAFDIKSSIQKIVDKGPITSSNPFDYIQASKEEYQKLLNHPKETFEYAIKDLINTHAEDGLKSYIEALLCSEINQNFKYDFESGRDYLENYEDFLIKCDCLYNEYDSIAKMLLK